MSFSPGSAEWRGIEGGMIESFSGILDFEPDRNGGVLKA
jgi:hypothetical protein